MRIALPIAIFVLMAASGCAGREELLAKSAAVPAGVDLSGQWRLHDDSNDSEKRRVAEQWQASSGSEDIIRLPSRAPQRSGQGSRLQSRPRSSGGTSVRMFLEAGETLKVTQTDHGLFISFDRSVVEEYRFGEKREISIGPVIADRVSGWEGETYIIETLDIDGAKLIETYRLFEDGRKLRRTIAIVNNDKEQLAIEQNFDRF